MTRARRGAAALASIPWLASIASVAACHRGEAVKRDDVVTTTKSSEPPARPCPVPDDGHVKGALTFPAGCAAKLERTLLVDEGGTLTIQPGVDLAFAPDARLTVRGALLASGTDAAKIRLHAAGKAWPGVEIEKGSGSRLEQVTIESVGPASTGAPPRAALVIGGDASEVALAQLTVRRCEPSALAVLEAPTRAGVTSGLARAEGLDFDAPATAGAPSIRIGARGLGAIVSAKLAAPVELNDPQIEAPTSWPKLEVPVVAPVGLVLGGAASGAARPDLTVADGTTLRVGAGHRVIVGDARPGKLLAHHVRFESAAAKPARGDWKGLLLRNAAGSEIFDCTIAHAGATAPVGAPPPAVITIGHGKPKVERTKFVDGVGLAIDAWSGCELYTSKAAANDFGGLKPCDARAAALSAELDRLELQMIGALSTGAPATDSVLTSGSSLPDIAAAGSARPGVGKGGSGSDLRAGGSATGGGAP